MVYFVYFDGGLLFHLFAIFGFQYPFVNHCRWKILYDVFSHSLKWDKWLAGRKPHEIMKLMGTISTGQPQFVHQNKVQLLLPGNMKFVIFSQVHQAKSRGLSSARILSFGMWKLKPVGIFWVSCHSQIWNILDIFSAVFQQNVIYKFCLFYDVKSKKLYLF